MTATEATALAKAQATLKAGTVFQSYQPKMRNLPLNRMQAEWLVDLLEKCDQKETGTWRHELASEIREMFGMSAYPEWQTSRVVKLPAWFWANDGFEAFEAVLMMEHEPKTWTHWMPFTGDIPSAPP